MSPQPPDLRSWLKASGHWVLAGSTTAAPITHVFLDGGKASVPAEARHGPGALTSAYARDVAAGRPLYAVERTHVGGTYRMFADMDVPLAAPEDGDDDGDDADPDEGWDSLELLSVVGRALAALPKELTPGEKGVGEIVVCTRRWQDGKTGAHLIWEGLRVDDRTASALRGAWVARLAEAEPEAAEWWDRTVDASVYRRNGLRMPWALKRGGTARAAYVPTHVFRPSREDALELAEVPAFSATDERAVVGWLRRTSIMAAAPGEPGADLPPFGPAVDDECISKLLLLMPLSCGGDAKKKPAAARKKSTKSVRKLKEEDEEGATSFPLSEEGRGALRAALPAVYGGGDTEIGACCRRLARGGVLVSCSSRFCHAAGREHGGNHVYFNVLGDGRVEQRCHSLKCAGASVDVGRVPASGLELLLGVTGKKAKKAKKPVGSLVPSSAVEAATYWMARMGHT